MRSIFPGSEGRLLRRVDPIGEGQPLRIAGIIQDSRVNGPGRRAVVHLQGCTLACPGCFNPETHDAAAGTTVRVRELADVLAKTEPDGVSISGGEPFQQRDGLVALVVALRRRGVRSILVFTGYTLAELERSAHGAQSLEGIDVLVAGRYEAKVGPGGPLLGSGNQRIHLLTNVHDVEDLQMEKGETELHIAPDGTITMTGFPPAKLRQALRALKK